MLLMCHIETEMHMLILQEVASTIPIVVMTETLEKGFKGNCT